MHIHKRVYPYIFFLALSAVIGACQNPPQPSADAVKPKYISSLLEHDSDDPAIYAKGGFFIGTDKETDGGVFAFDFTGKLLTQNSVKGLQRPNNVDIQEDVLFGDSLIDIAVVTERQTQLVRIYQLPSMKAIDGGGIEAFAGETGADFRDVMGIACYRNPTTGKTFMIVGRKNGPKEAYLWQYELNGEDGIALKATVVRKFGTYSQKKEIEAIAVDDEMGFVYYCDEQVGIRKYHADPEKGNAALSLFGEGLFKEDNEGIAIYKPKEGKHYLVVSDQAAGRLIFFDRAGENEPLGYVNYSALETDGIEIESEPILPDFPAGLLVAMSTDKTFHLYGMKELLEALKPLENPQSK